MIGIKPATGDHVSKFMKVGSIPCGCNTVLEIRDPPIFTGIQIRNNFMRILNIPSKYELKDRKLTKVKVLI